MTGKTRPPRKPASGRGKERVADRPLDVALRVDSNDSILRVLSDFDFDPTRTSQEDIERRIDEATALPAGGPVRDRVPSDIGPAKGSYEAHISEILAELMDDDADPFQFTAPRSIVPAPALAKRRLEVALARGRRYLAATDGLPFLPGSVTGAATRIAQGRALLGYLEVVPSPDVTGAHGAVEPVDAAILTLCRKLGHELADLMPAEYDLEAPHLPPAGGPLGRAKVPADPGSGELGTLLAAYAAVRREVSARREILAAARDAWTLGTALLGQIERLAAGRGCA